MKWLHCLLLQPTLKLATSTPSNRHAGFIKTTHHKSVPRKRIKHTFYKFVDLAQGIPPWFTITPHTHTHTHAAKECVGGGIFSNFLAQVTSIVSPWKGFYTQVFWNWDSSIELLSVVYIWRTTVSAIARFHFFLLESGPLSVRGSSRLCLVLCWGAGMATLPGTMPRMMRPAPGQNYPRTGFPLEGEI
jgi:hypothetical protein